MIEQHDAFMKQLRGGQEAPKPRPARAAEPEGVALYQCAQILPDRDVVVGFHICGRGTEAKPYDPIPRHCDFPMTLVGYDWTRDASG